MSETETKSSVDQAVALIRANPKLSKAEAARQAGCSREAVRDRLKKVGSSTDGPPDLALDPGEIVVIERDYSHLDKLHVYPLGDVHKGSPNHQSAKWKQWCDWLADQEAASLLGTGDFLNTALRTSVSDVYEETATVGDAKWELADELRPIAEDDRIDLLIPGNHEGRIHAAIGDCPIRDVAKLLDVPYAKTAALIVYTVGDVEYEVYLRHGSGSGRSGAQANRMERESQIIVADIYVAGHTHRQQIIRGAIFQRVGSQVVRRRQVYCTSGSFLSYEDYAARQGLLPADVGAPRIRLDGRKKDAHASI